MSIVLALVAGLCLAGDDIPGATVEIVAPAPPPQPPVVILGPKPAEENPLDGIGDEGGVGGGGVGDDSDTNPPSLPEYITFTEERYRVVGSYPQTRGDMNWQNTLYGENREKGNALPLEFSKKLTCSYNASASISINLKSVTASLGFSYSYQSEEVVTFKVAPGQWTRQAILPVIANDNVSVDEFEVTYVIPAGGGPRQYVGEQYVKSTQSIVSHAIGKMVYRDGGPLS